MNDSYAEWLVKRKNPAYNIVLKAALVLLCAISLVLALVTPFGIIILTVVGIASYFAFQSLSQEFEYLILDWKREMRPMIRSPLIVCLARQEERKAGKVP